MEINIYSLNLDELQDLQAAVRRRIEELTLRHQVFTFEFEAAADPRKFGAPYVARLFYNLKEGKIKRDFFDLAKTRGLNSVTVYGHYQAKAGDVIEQRTGGSWEREYRDWYVVTDNGLLQHVADIYHSRNKAEVEKYLKGSKTLNQLVQTLHSPGNTDVFI